MSVRVQAPAKVPSVLSLSWWVRPSGLAIALVSLVLVLGTIGYVVIEGWSVWDAFFMTVISVTTVGYREVRELSRLGEVFTALLLIGGVGAVLYAITLFGARVVESGVHHRWEYRVRQRMLEQLTDHFIICGYGRIGSVIAEEFLKQHVPFVVVDREESRAAAASAAGALAVEGDATAEEVLELVGIRRAKGIIAALSTDAENVYTILSARLLRPDLYIIGRAETEDSARKIRRAGADRVVAPYQIGALHIAQTALRPAVVEFVQLVTSSEYLELQMEQVRIGSGATLAGHTIVGANLRQRFGVIVIGIQRADGRMEFNPAPESLMHEGDHLVVLGRPESLKELVAVARGEAVRGGPA